MEFRYEGFIRAGTPKRGLITAGSEGEASAMLREMGVFINSLEPNGPSEMKTALTHRNEISSPITMKPVELKPTHIGDQPIPSTWITELHGNMKAIQLVETEWKQSYDGVADEGFNAAKNEAVRQAVLRAIKAAL